MRVLLSTCAHGDVKPMVGRPVQLRALGAEVPVCTLPDLAGMPVGQPVRPLATGETPPAAGPARRAAGLVAAQFDTVAAAAEGCDPLVATGVMPAGVWL
jgi:vancomycin aglycone glucosyltransferase